MNHSHRIDLAAADGSPLELAADICIVGAGAAGALLARISADRGRSIVVLEAGPVVCASPSDVGFDASFTSSPYAGATRGRFFGLGGSTSHWGGLLAPHTALDFLPPSGNTSDELDAAWKHVVEVVTNESAAVLALLGWRFGAARFSHDGMRLPTGVRDCFATSFTTFSSLYLPFRLKNLAWLLSQPRVTERRCHVVHHAVASTWQLERAADGKARIAAVEAVSTNGRRVTVRANHFVIAAGALESTRILLEINQAGGHSVLPSSAAVGCYLGDHLSVPIADVVTADRPLVVKAAAPRFTGAWMWGARIVERERPTDASRAFLHYIFEITSSGFMLAKEVLQSFQRGRLPAIGWHDGLRGAAGLYGLIHSRLIRSELHIPHGTPIRLQLDLEQCRTRNNCVRLADDTDRYGRRKLVIDWAIRDTDRTQIVATASRILGKWPVGPGIPRLERRSLETKGLKPHDAYHPVGTCRMGTDPEAVVEHDLRVAGTSNLWVASTAVLPSAGTANPTFTLLCLAHDLGHRLSS
jgi:choline dehydrogenase-like flavoprotein